MAVDRWRAARMAAAALALLAASGAALADDGKTGADHPTASGADAKANEKSERPPMPADVTTEQHLALPGRTLRYHATVGSLPLENDKNEHKADIFYIAYTLDDGKSAADRPITFVFNGGPGAASAYLHLGALGPKHLAFGNDGGSPSAPPKLADNPDTWLDFTDLVFVDPVGTGYSSTVSGSSEDDKLYWGVDQDVESLSGFIARYLAKTGRTISPHYLVGESYGGFRGPKIAHHLQTHEGVGVSGIVLISPAIDFVFLSEEDLSPLPDMARLPSLAAVALEAKGPVTPEMLKPVEDYAAGPYVSDLIRGRSDPAAADRMAEKVAGLIGLPAPEVKRLGSQIGMRTFARATGRDRGVVSSIYDGSVHGFDPFPQHEESRFEDPILRGTIAPLTSAMVDYVRSTLGYKIDRPYRLLNEEVGRRWDWDVTKNGEFPELPSAVDDLKEALALDPKLKILIAHGMTDTITPFFASRYIIDHVPAFGDPDRLLLRLYPGGHMLYTRDSSRAALRADAIKLYPAS